MVKPIISGPYRTFRRLHPHESFLEYEGSTITIPMRGRRSPQEPWMEDEISLKAFMRLEIYPSYFNMLETREFQFTIRDWDLYGTCPMLNRLFYDDPRGYLPPGGRIADYVPATATFRVSNTYRAHLPAALAGSELFASPGELDIRNLTSHALRQWAVLAEREHARWTYTNPEQRIYFDVLPAKMLVQEKLKTVFDQYVDAEKKLGRTRILPNKPLIIFHKKAPPPEGRDQTFDLADVADRARYLLALGSIVELPKTKERGGERQLEFHAGNPLRGLRANITQIQGNTTLSSHSRPLEEVEIIWKLSPRIRDERDLDQVIEQAGGVIHGNIQITSPARSLGTADQGPGPGEPFDSADFPARITYAINYDIFLNKVRFVEDNAGIAIAVGALEIPPRDVTVAFDKVHVGHVIDRYLEFDKGHCTGMHEITPGAYHHGQNFARYWRQVPLSPDDDWSGFQDFDPNRSY